MAHSQERQADHSQRICHVIGSLSVGGAERMLLAMCQRLNPQRFTSAAIVIGRTGGQLAPDFARAGVQELACLLRPGLTFPVRLYGEFRRGSFDVVVSHVSLASGLVLLIAWCARVPKRVALFHSDGDARSFSAGRKFYRGVARWMVSMFATEIVGVTHRALEFGGVARTPRRRRLQTHLIPNAVDLDRFLPADKIQAREGASIPIDALVVGHVGRAAPEKNRAALPEILRYLPTGSVMVLAGSEDVRDLQLEKLCGRVSERICNMGALSDVRKVFGLVDVFVLPSKREGLPLVLLEALASGCPVVASDLPGIRASLGELEGVYLVPAEASPAAFAEAIQQAASSGTGATELRNALVAAGLDLESYCARWETVFVG